MSGKGGDRTTNPVANIDSPEKIRNIALVGHSGAGKTTLVEALLAATGAINKMGSVADGNTVSDFDSVEVRQQRSVSLALAPVEHQGIKINVLDTPGYPDFIGELRAGLRAADGVLFVVSAVDGVDAATISLWEECAALDLPRAVVITKLDQHRADFDAILAICQRVFGESVLPLYLPLHHEETIGGLINLLSQNILDYTNGDFTPTEHPAETEHLEFTTEARNALIEGIIAESEDESLMDQYLSGVDIPLKTLIGDLETAVARGSFFPVLSVCAPTGVGITELLAVMVNGFPSPLEHEIPAVTDIHGRPHHPLDCDPAGPLVAEIVKTSVDPYVGRVSLVRVFSGTLHPDTQIHISGHGLATRGHPDHDSDDRASHLFSPLGTHLRPVSQAVAGDLCAITKLEGAETGDTISAKTDPLLIAAWDMPEPLLPVAIQGKTRGDEDALAKGLTKLIAGDSTLRLERNAATHQLVLWCMGEAHAEVLLDRLREQNIDLEILPVIIPLRETFTGPAQGHGRYVKQSGGHGQFGICDITVEPLSRGAGFEFVDKIVGGAIPHQFVLSVEKGIRQQMAKGVVAGHELVDIRVTLVDGKTHSVDSSDTAFMAAGAIALRDAAQNGNVHLLEPVDDVAVTIPDDHVGAVMSDLAGRRGRVTGTESLPGERSIVRAEVPQAGLLRYAVELRSLSAGTGRFQRTFARYEAMPEHAAREILARQAES